MPQHHHGLVVTDIAVATCSRLNPFSSCKLDEDVWHRVEKDLYLDKRWTARAYMHVQRKKEEELTAGDKVVMDVTVGRLDPTTSVKGQADERWEQRQAGIWVLRSSKLHASDSKKAVTAVDVLFGDDAVEAREGWEIPGTHLLLDVDPEIPVAHITVRRGSQIEPTKPQLRVRDNGKFKIMQLADIHLSTGVGHCRDPVPDEYDGGPCMADPRTLDFVSKLLEDEKPDLVVLSGDQVNGDTSPDAQSVRKPFKRGCRGAITDDPRSSSNMLHYSLNTKFPTFLSSETMMTRGPCREKIRWQLSSSSRIHSPKLDQTTSTAWATTMSRFSHGGPRHIPQ